MTRKALARRIARVLFNEPATRRGAGAALTLEGCAAFAQVLCCSSVKDHCGYSPSSRRAPGQNPPQRCYTSRGLGALARNELVASPSACFLQAGRHRQQKLRGLSDQPPRCDPASVTSSPAVGHSQTVEKSRFEGS